MGRLARLTWQSGTGKPAAAAPDHLPNGPPRSLLARILGLSIIEVRIFSAIGPRLVSGAYRLHSPSRRSSSGTVLGTVATCLDEIDDRPVQFGGSRQVFSSASPAWQRRAFSKRLRAALVGHNRRVFVRSKGFPGSVPALAMIG